MSVVTLEEQVGEAVADELAGGLIHGLLNRHDLAKRAAMDGFRQGVGAAERILREMAAAHTHAGDAAGAKAIWEALEQVRTLPQNEP